MKKYARKSISISDKKIQDYIKNESNKRGVSEAFFVESLIEKSMMNDTFIKNKNTPLFSSLVKKNNKSGLDEINKSSISKMILGWDMSKENFKIPIQGALLINERNNINNINIKKIIRDFLSKKLYDIDIFHNYNNIHDNLLKDLINNQDDIITLALFSVDRIELDNCQNDLILIKKLTKLHKDIISNINFNAKNSRSIKKYIDECYTQLEGEISSIINNYNFYIKVKFKRIILPIVIDDNINRNHNFYDYLNVKYLSYRSLMEYGEYNFNFVCLLKGAYGFFYCDIFQNHKDSAYFKNRFNELKNEKSNRENLGTFIMDNTLIKFMPDYPEVRRGSKLINKIIEIKKQKETMIKNSIKSAVEFEFKNSLIEANFKSEISSSQINSRLNEKPFNE